MSAAFFLGTGLAKAIGYMSGYAVEAITSELKPLCYFPMLFFFFVAIRTREDVRLVATIFVACGVALATMFLLTVSGTHAGLLDYKSVYAFLHQSDEFIFRHNPTGPFLSFLYKGAFYICVAAIFLLFDPYRKTKYLALLLIIAIAATLTRGLCIALLASILLGIVLKRAPALIGQAAVMSIILVAMLQAERPC